MLKKNENVKVKIVDIDPNFILVNILNQEKNIVSKIDITETFWSKPFPFVKNTLKIGDLLDAVVTFSNEDKTYLSLKRNKINPFLFFDESYKINDLVEVNPIKNTEIGLFVSTKEGINGIIHPSDVPNDYYFNDNPLKLKLLSKDKVNCRILLSF